MDPQGPEPDFKPDTEGSYARALHQMMKTDGWEIFSTFMASEGKEVMIPLLNPRERLPDYWRGRVAQIERFNKWIDTTLKRGTA